MFPGMFATTPPSVLIADSEPYLCRVFEARLSKNNEYQVRCVSSGDEAMRAAIEQAFDAILWDMRLRDTTRIAPRLRALCPRAALLLMTTDDRPVLRADLARLDVADMLVKPFGLDLLAERLRAALTVPLLGSAGARIELAQVGQLIRLNHETGVCLTRVLEAEAERFTVVAPPRVETSIVYQTGMRLRAEALGEDALYVFRSRLLRERERPVPSWELAMPQVIHRRQRRKHPRHSLNATAHLHRPPEAWEVPLDAEDWRMTSGVALNISLGGCALVSDKDAPVGAEVVFDMQPTGGIKLEGRGRILRVQPITSSAATFYRIAVLFTDLEEPTRKHLRSLLLTP